MRNDFAVLYQMVEIGLQWLGAVTGLGTLGFAISNMLIAQGRPTGIQTGAARKVLRTPYLVIATIAFIGLALGFWKPLPLQVSARASLTTAITGTIFMLPGMALYIWGLRTLGENFNASSGFGVRLLKRHELVTNGPFAYMRHPMYLGAMVAFWGGLLIYRTWTMLGFAVMMFGLVYRGIKEEQALAQAFGSQWEAYKRCVPGWLPRLKRTRAREIR